LRTKLLKIATAAISTVICVSILWGADLYLHRKHGVNLWGYRGAALGRKLPGEKRVAVLGGSTTWGYGLNAGQDFPAQLEQMLAQNKGADTPAIKVLNLGFNGEGAYSFTQTLGDYDYLDPDVVILYSGYNDLNAPNYYNFRHRTPLFKWTGYLPLLPSLTADKLSAWTAQLTGRHDQTVFAPPTLDHKDEPSGLRQQLDRPPESTTEKREAANCSSKWQFYCEHVNVAAEMALAKGERVLIVTEPYISNAHVEQQAQLESMLAARFANQPRLRYINLGRLIDLRDPSLCWDGMHLNEEGNRRIATALSEPVREMLQR
jgi:lysophospholipase L1-like esterase